MQTTQSSSMSGAVAAANKELVSRFYHEVFVNWDLTLVDRLVDPQFRSDDWPESAAPGPQGFRDFYAGVRSAFPDTRYEVDDLIAEGDRVVVRWRLLGTHLGPFGERKPTGRPITLKGIAIYRVEDGMLMERWVVYDLDGLIRQIEAPTV
jgi:predicted ester cyclase